MADSNGDGVVDITDLTAVTSHLAAGAGGNGSGDDGGGDDKCGLGGAFGLIVPALLWAVVRRRRG